ncbi:MAG TPA: 3-hydroxyacyl-CoA dehydrogenase NAD-binding domain-containing protein, partial [Chryseolinea sp.]|nr:3-hydroxyacyl-CoA dehydrogenase NAD-binding domain-containing protein [Chryseolinea sp.]
MNMKKVTVLGAGLVGKTIAIDLSKKFDVTSFDINTEALEDLRKYSIKTQRVDFTKTNELQSKLMD